ncbi:hypothetical protein ONZ45_g7528 [Pleurotus djamor]|nr:hypothetical protein ONZ45_g7528 [Pleurotus djamor]
MIRSLRSKRNTHSYISQLPDEILAMIFALSRDENIISAPGLPIQWLCVTAVCRHWRQVALDTPLLWSFIDFRSDETSLDCATQFLERSKSAPLSLVASFSPTSNTIDRLKNLLTDTMATRDIRELAVHPCGTKGKTLGTFMECRPATFPPYLLSLTLEGTSADTNTSTNYLWNELPALQSLNLLHMPLPAVIPYLPKLRSLKITNANFTPLRALQILQEIPLLEAVHLDQLIQPSWTGSVPHVHLPQLRTLDLKGDSFENSRILKYLHFEATTSVSFIDSSQRPVVETSLIHDLREAFAAAELNEAHIFMPCSTSFHIKFFHHSTDLPPRPSLSIRSLGGLEFMALIPPFRIEYLTLHLINCHWDAFLPYFDSVKSLTLINASLNALDHLKPPLTLNTNGPAKNSSRLMLPELKTLVLEEYFFGRGRNRGVDADDHRKLLRMRHIETVRIKRGWTTHAVHAQLSEVVKGIEWEKVGLCY